MEDIQKDTLIALVAALAPIISTLIGIMPKFSTKTRRSALLFSLGAVITIATGLFLNRVVLPSAGAPANTQIGLTESIIRYKQVVVHARILYFKDKSKGEQPQKTKRIGRTVSGKGFEEDLELYDEAVYDTSYVLHPHRVKKIKMESHSSGKTDITLLKPRSVRYEIDEYDKTKGSTLPFKVGIEKENHILLSRHYYNGFQKNKKGKYESDGGIHLNWPADEVIVILDLTAFDYQTLIPSKPSLWMIKDDGSRRELTVTYDDGILRSSRPIKEIPKNSTIWWDWEWSTETKL